MFTRSKKVVALIGALVVVAGGFFSTCFLSNASNEYNFTYNHVQPSATDSTGWIALLLFNGSGYETRVYSFNCMAVNADGAYVGSMCYINLSSYLMEIGPYGYTGSEGAAFYSVHYLQQDGGMQVAGYSSSERWKGTFTGQIVDFKVYGGAVVTSNTIPVSSMNWNVYFHGGDLMNKYISYLVTYIKDISTDGLGNVQDVLEMIELYISELSDSAVDMTAELEDIESVLIGVRKYLKDVVAFLGDELDDVEEQLDDIYNTLDSCENYLSQILEAEKMQNTWLEKIYNFFAEKDEKDKEAATQAGNQSTADIDNMIQDDSAGFVDSLGGLTSSMSYTGTNCSWTFPTVKLPAISGVMDEVTLIESQEIDFTYWVNSIPSGILLLVQSVCTVALIVFCFKELYGAISYALTLKGGGSE